MVFKFHFRISSFSSVHTCICERNTFHTTSRFLHLPQKYGLKHRRREWGVFLPIICLSIRLWLSAFLPTYRLFLIICFDRCSHVFFFHLFIFSSAIGGMPVSSERPVMHACIPVGSAKSKWTGWMCGWRHATLLVTDGTRYHRNPALPSIKLLLVLLLLEHLRCCGTVYCNLAMLTLTHKCFTFWFMEVLRYICIGRFPDIFIFDLSLVRVVWSVIFFKKQSRFSLEYL